MILYLSLIGFCWIVLLVVWFIYSSENKDNVRRNNSREKWIRLSFIAVIIVLLSIDSVRGLNDVYLFSTNDVVQTVGVVICACGVSFAIWARITMGKNWGTPMTLKEQPDLVVSGPYKFVRHPIYAGICVAMVGSMTAVSVLLTIWFLLAGTSFIYSAKMEEKDMLQVFGEEYSHYKKRTKMFIPFIC